MAIETELRLQSEDFESDLERARRLFIERVTSVKGLFEITPTTDGVDVVADGDARLDVFAVEADVLELYPGSNLQVHVRRARRVCD